MSAKAVGELMWLQSLELKNTNNENVELRGAPSLTRNRGAVTKMLRISLRGSAKLGRRGLDGEPGWRGESAATSRLACDTQEKDPELPRSFPGGYPGGPRAGDPNLTEI